MLAANFSVSGTAPRSPMKGGGFTTTFQSPLSASPFQVPWAWGKVHVSQAVWGSKASPVALLPFSLSLFLNGSRRSYTVYPSVSPCRNISCHCECRGGRHSRKGRFQRRYGLGLYPLLQSKVNTSHFPIETCLCHSCSGS